MSLRIASALTVLLLLAACGGEEETPSDASEMAAAAGSQEPAGLQLSPAQERGRQLFEMVCWTCHGTSGRGDGPAVRAGSVPAPPNLLISHYAEMTPDEIVRLFAAVIGQQDEEHPHMQYMTSLIEPDKFTEALRYVPALAYPTDLPGSALSGQRIYEMRCQGCHGVEGRGDGPWATELRYQPPADFTHDTLLASENYEAAFARIRDGGRTVHGSSMPPWGVVLSEEEIWDVLAYISTFQRSAGD